MRQDDAVMRESTGFDPVASLHSVAVRNGVPALAHRLGKSPQVMYAKLTESVEHKTPSLREAVAITHITGDLGLLRDWARAEGGVFIPLPSQSAGDEDVLDDLIRLTESLGDFAHRLRDARADGVVTPLEFEEQLVAASEIHANLQRLLADLKEQVRELPTNVRAISAARRTNGLHYEAIGHCLNCGPEVPLPPGKRWCDPDCRDDFLRREGRP